jgi:hypothetical protein
LDHYQEAEQLLKDLLAEDGNHTGTADLLQQIRTATAKEGVS